MSYTEIYRITKSGNTKRFAEIRNAFRGGMAVWNILEKRYLPIYAPYGFEMSRTVNEKEIQKVWDLADDDRLSEEEKICLKSTFDNVLVLYNDIPRLLNAFRMFDGICSLKEQADAIEAEYKKRKFYGICWNQTSVNADIPPKNINGKYWDLFALKDLTDGRS